MGAPSDPRNHPREHVYEGARPDGQVGGSVLRKHPPDETVKLVFNLSQDEDARGPWNEEPDFEYVADPKPEGGFLRLRSTLITKAITRRRQEGGTPNQELLGLVSSHKRVSPAAQEPSRHRPEGRPTRRRARIPDGLIRFIDRENYKLALESPIGRPIGTDSKNLTTAPLKRSF